MELQFTMHMLILPNYDTKDMIKEFADEHHILTRVCILELSTSRLAMYSVPLGPKLLPSNLNTVTVQLS